MWIWAARGVAMSVHSLLNEEQKKVGSRYVWYLATHFGPVHDITEADCWAQNGSTHGHVFATFKCWFFLQTGAEMEWKRSVYWQSGRDLLPATGVTWGWNGYRNMSQHRKLALEKKIHLPLLQGLEPMTFWLWVPHSNHWAIPAPAEACLVLKYKAKCEAETTHSLFDCPRLSVEAENTCLICDCCRLNVESETAYPLSDHCKLTVETESCVLVVKDDCLTRLV